MKVALREAGVVGAGPRRRWGSATSARRPSCGIAGPAGRCITRSCGRTPGPPRPGAALAAGGVPAGASGADRFRARTGLPISTYSSALKLAWILDEGGHRAAAERGELLFGTIDSWLTWQLTGGAGGGGVHVTDVTNASRTMLMDLATLEWDPGAARRDADPAPRCSPRSAARPRSTATGTGDLAGVPIAGILGDQQAALFGQTCFEAGEVKCTYGTGCFMLMHTGEAPVQSEARAHHDGRGAARRPGHARHVRARRVRGGRRARSSTGCATTSGSSATRPRSRRSPVPCRTAATSCSCRRSRGLFAPHWRSDARGVIAGLTRFATKAHIARAALESTAYQVYDLGVAMTADLGTALPGELRVDGGHDPQRAADAVPGRHPRSAGRRAADRGDLGPRRGLRGGPGGRLLERPRRAQGDGFGVAPLDAVDGRATRDAGIARWHKGLERTLGWAT